MSKKEKDLYRQLIAQARAELKANRSFELLGLGKSETKDAHNKADKPEAVDKIVGYDGLFSEMTLLDRLTLLFGVSKVDGKNKTYIDDFYDECDAKEPKIN